MIDNFLEQLARARGLIPAATAVAATPAVGAAVGGGLIGAGAAHLFNNRNQGKNKGQDKKPPLYRENTKQAGGTFSKGPQMPDWMQMLMGGEDQQAVDYSSAIAGIFGPQIDALRQAEALRQSDLERRFNQGSAAVNGAYNATADAMRARDPQIAANYQQGQDAVNANSNAANAAVDQNYQDSMAQQAALMNQFGIQEGGSQVLDQSRQGQNAANNAINVNQAALTNQLAAGGTSARNYNNTVSGAVNMQGNNEYSRQFSDYLSQQSAGSATYMQALASLLGQQSQAQLEAQMSQAGGGDDWQRTAQIIDWMRQDEQNAYDRSQQQYENSQLPRSPYDNTYAVAVQQLGDDQAQVAMQILQQAGAGDPATSQIDFINRVSAQGRAAGLPADVMAQIASQWYSQAELPAQYSNPLGPR